MTGQKRELSPEEMDLISGGGNFEIQHLMSDFNQSESTRSSKQEHQVYMHVIKNLVA